jgi:hypothetical protein
MIDRSLYLQGDSRRDYLIMRSTLRNPSLTDPSPEQDRQAKKNQRFSKIQIQLK